MRKRVRRRGIYEYNPFASSGYFLPEGARGALERLLLNNQFWQYSAELRKLKEKEQAVIAEMDAIIRRIQKSAKDKKGKRVI